MAIGGHTSYPYTVHSSEATKIQMRGLENRVHSGESHPAEKRGGVLATHTNPPPSTTPTTPPPGPATRKVTVLYCRYVNRARVRAAAEMARNCGARRRSCGVWGGGLREARCEMAARGRAVGRIRVLFFHVGAAAIFLRASVFSAARAAATVAAARADRRPLWRIDSRIAGVCSRSPLLMFSPPFLL